MSHPKKFSLSLLRRRKFNLHIFPAIAEKEMERNGVVYKLSWNLLCFKFYGEITRNLEGFGCKTESHNLWTLPHLKGRKNIILIFLLSTFPPKPIINEDTHHQEVQNLGIDGKLW
jgi:hypothetical protein